ncbi:hypothetical protein [Microbacterium oleivorans]|uniref:hypothetical protein n=1 Tax=Microbacterium oleivorans TaxID=273677 RepID=UPI001CB91D23|nr:hypothetical protein [Microbacterium oleivorans]
MLITTVGLVTAGLIALGYAGAGDFEAGPIGRAGGEYALSPWTNPDPVVAEEPEADTYRGPDGAVIRLTDLDVDTPIILTPAEGTRVSAVWVTGTDGRMVTEGEGGEPPRFSPLRDGQVVILVEQPDVELWIDGPSDETWEASLRFDRGLRADDVLSSSQTLMFTHDGGATTARVSARGGDNLSIQAVTAHGSERPLNEDSPFDRSIAWRDSPLVLFYIESWHDTAWRIEFPTDAASTPTPTVTP